MGPISCPPRWSGPAHLSTAKVGREPSIGASAVDVAGDEALAGAVSGGASSSDKPVDPEVAASVPGSEVPSAGEPRVDDKPVDPQVAACDPSVEHCTLFDPGEEALAGAVVGGARVVETPVGPEVAAREPPIKLCALIGPGGEVLAGAVIDDKSIDPEVAVCELPVTLCALVDPGEEVLPAEEGAGLLHAVVGCVCVIASAFFL